MVNFVAAQTPIRNFLCKLAGLRQQTVPIDPEGTSVSFWLPTKPTPTRPVVVLIHGFAAEGIVTWQFQSGPLAKLYDVYVPDLLFFGGSTTPSADRSPDFQAVCLSKALDALGVDRCTLVGFSYGGMVAFKLAELRAGRVDAMVVSGSVMAMTDSISQETLERLGFRTSSELLLPESARGLKALMTVAMHKKMWFPEKLYRDFLEVSFSNRKERAELLEGLVVSTKADAQTGAVPAPGILPQMILLLWGEEDQIFNVELAKAMKEQLGDNVTFQSIKNAGHLVHIERPCAYNKHLKEFLKLVYDSSPKKEQ